MRITFAGVGEAFDETEPNTSILFESGADSLLADCGFTAAAAFWRAAESPLNLGGIYITHFHGDHYFGVPALILRMVEEGRTKALAIMGQEGVEERVVTLMEMAYRNVLSKARFNLLFTECAPGDDVTLGSMRLTFAANDHPMPSQSLRVDALGVSAFYSGDGRPTEDTRRLAEGCDLVIHESFSLEQDTPGHGTVDSSIAFAREVGAKALALVHIKRTEKRDCHEKIMALATTSAVARVFMPVAGETITIQPTL